ncbi:MAG: septum formation initiator family protein [Microthrixaceae bacterium]|nr:septum formation initiator family protein [Microthrixaceae bacterium]
MSRRARLLRVGLVAAVALVVGVLVLPGRLWFGQRAELSRAEAQLSALDRSNDALDKRVDQLNSNAAIEREAREELGLVYPRDELYTLTTPPAPVVNLPKVWPFNRVQDALAKAAAPTAATPSDR